MHPECKDCTCWSVARVKDLLPDVVVYLTETRERAVGVIRGRKLDFARVCVGDRVYEYSWSQVANALRDGRPLVA